jgi:hypothetical protein
MAKQMIKRADGSTSQRGLWDNIRANKGSGKKPTSAMLKQEKKIKAKKAQDGTFVKNAVKDTLQSNVGGKSPELAEVTARPGFGKLFKENMRKFMTTDSTDFPKLRAKVESTSYDKRKFGTNTDAKRNLNDRKLLSGIPRVLSAPVAATTSAFGAGIDAVRNAIKNKKELNKIPDKKKMGGKVAKKIAPKMMMKKTKKK